MTPEEKAKAYDEALERARQQRDDYQKELDKTDKNSQLAGILRAGISAVEMVFPQITESESEDERIRKQCIELLREAYSTKYEAFECIAWLERQKECVADNSNTSESDDEKIRKELVEYHKQQFEKNCDQEVGLFHKDALAYLEKQKEQKDYNKLYEDIGKSEWFKKAYEGKSLGCDYEQKEQKPVSISCGHENDAEWGQEDKEKIVTISEIIEHCTTIPYSGGTLTLNKEYKKELLCFIKSLRPQYHGDVTMTEAYKMGLEAGKASSWKPSEHQMNILKAVKDYVGKGSGYWGEALGSLIDDLEKLG